MTPLADAYIRVSLEEQARDGYSLEMQERSIAAYCEAMGWQLRQVYADRGASGKDIAGRPEMRRLLADVASGRGPDRVVVWKLDRLGRRVKDIIDISDQLDRRGAAVVSIKESFDASTSTGRAFRNILATMAELERDVIIERISANLAEKARQGELLGTIPIGYRKVNGAVEPDPATAPRIRELFERYAAGGTSLLQLAAVADSIGLATTNGRPYDRNKLRAVLRNPAYAGDVAYYTRHQKTPKAVYPGKHEAIISRETFDRVQQVLKRQSVVRRRGNFGRSAYALTGIARCGHCGGPMHGNRATSGSGATRQYMACASRLMRGSASSCLEGARVRVELLEGDVAAYLCGMQLPDRAIDKVVGEFVGRSRASGAAADVAKVEAQLERLQRLFVLGDLDELAYRRQRDQLRQRLAALQPAEPVDPRWAVQRLRQVGDLWLDGDTADRRQLAQEFFARLDVHAGAVTVIVPAAGYLPFFAADRLVRFGQKGPEYPAALPIAGPGVLSYVRPRGLDTPQLRTPVELRAA